MTAVITAIMDSEFPICTTWGDEFIQIYNSGYNAIYGDKHPDCFGQPARESWPEIWPFLEPALAQIRSTRSALRFENTMLALVKHREPEECWFDFCYSPLTDDTGSVTGVLSVAIERTLEVVSRRRTESCALSTPGPCEDPLAAIAQSMRTALGRNGMDVRMGALYAADAHTGAATETLWTIGANASDQKALRDQLPFSLPPQDHLRRFDLPLRGEDEQRADRGVSIALLNPLGRPAGWLQLVPHRLVREDSHLDFARSPAEQVRRLFGVLQSHAQEVGEVRAELSSNEQLYRFLFDHIDDAAFYTINHGDQQELEVVAAVNQKASDLLGYSPAELVGMRREELFFPGDPALVEAVRTRSRENIFVGEMTCRRQDGSPVLVEISSRLIDLPSGQHRSVSLVRDISRRKRKEQERLEQARYEAVSLLTGGIAHDFNNLLTVILNSIELIDMTVPKEVGIAPFVENALKSAQRGATLTSQLLAYSRRQVQQRDIIQINDVVVDSRELLESMLGHHQLVLDLATELPPCAFDPTQLTTILLNLSANARDAMGIKGCFTLKTRVDAKTGHVVLTARDTGGGMAPDILDRIFDPYFTTKTIGHGTGLGLAMVKGLMNQAGGDVVVSTRPGRGSTFSLRFPVAAAAAAAIEPPDLPEIIPPASLQDCKVLLVDDNELILKQVARILRAEGAQVSVAGSSRDALHMLAQKPDLELVISDVVMPGGMTGAELMSQVRDEAPQMARLLMSGYVPEEMGHPALASEVAPLLRKPFTRHELMTAVLAALASSRR